MPETPTLDLQELQNTNRVQVPQMEEVETPEAFMQRAQANLVRLTTPEAQARDQAREQLTDATERMESSQEVFERGLRESGVNEMQEARNRIREQLGDINRRYGQQQDALARGSSRRQSQLQLEQSSRRNAIEAKALEVEASLLSQDIESARSASRDLANFAFQDQQAELNQLQRQYDMLAGEVSGQEAQVLQMRQQEREEKQAELNFLKQNVASAIASGASPSEVAQLTDPRTTNADKLALAQAVQARIAREDRALDRANISSQIAARNNALTQVSQTGDTSQFTNTVDLVRDSINRVLGGTDPDGGEYDALYKASGANPIAEFVRRNIGSSATDKTRLSAQLDTIRSNMLMLGSDPNIRDFFGPQMSEADVRMMMSSATRLQESNQDPAEIRDEVVRIDNFLGKLDSAVQAKAGGYTVNPNVLTAPDGMQIEIID